MEILLRVLILIFSILIAPLLYLQRKENKQPPSPPALPIVGHLHLLRNTAPHLAFHKLSIKYGPLVSLRFGIRRILVVSSPSLAEECFSKTNDIVFANRPESISSKHLGYNHTTLVFSPYGDHWRNLRRLTAIHIFYSISLLQSSSIWTNEMRFIVKKLFSSCSDEKSWKVVDLNSLFLELVFNVVMKMIAGKRWPFDQLDDAFTPSTFSDICDYIPIFRWIGFRGQEKSSINLQRKRDKVLQDLIEETRKRNGEDVSCSTKTKEIIQALLSLQDADPEYYTNETIKGIMQIMFTAGTHTSAFTMERAMSCLLNHPDILQKAKNEIDDQVTYSGRLLEDSDLSKLPYLRCIINETLRIFPPEPTLVPHYSSEDCIIGGYKIAKDTTLFVNAWAIHRDPNLWEEPSEFKPERFEGLDEGFKFLPFGKGRRACPGAAMAMRFVGLAVGTLVQCFEWESAESQMVEFDEKSGVTLGKTKPLEVLYKPRLSMVSLISQR
ncbi:cytochrome P450 81E8-like [Coffea eugenioides]|uniref:cytochrome P450 81E8-like n=1 Tax=Coffea eugenioides TaxID=49369 RepID=UPI000F6126FE|nr:cytochrome P450 81E8-like [Coffea eugenioides]